MECNFESGGQDAVASTRFDRPVKIAENYTSPENSDTRFTTKLIVRGRSFKHPLRYNQFCQFLCGCFQAPFAILALHSSSTKQYARTRRIP